jgi:two-component system sensor histidine kinase AlgZ
MLAGLGNRRGALLLGAAWLALGAALGAALPIGWGTAWGAALLFAMPLTLVYGSAIGFSAYYLCRSYPLATRSPGVIVLVFVLAAACAGGLWGAAGIAWRDFLLNLMPAMELGVDRQRLFSAMFSLGVLLYGAAAVLHYLAIEYATARQSERRELELALQARDAELRMLRTQIDPHFLFNSLNSISALTAFDADGAREMTLRLAEFFRYGLGLEAQRKVTLAQELALVGHFVAIEQVRFGARLRFDSKIGVGTDACLLPPMILQPLVENAVKHGVGSLPQGGCVRVAAARDGTILRIVVENDVDHDTPHATPRGQGLGLANVRARMATDYGHLASVHWRRNDATFRVELTLPADTLETPCA